MILNKNHSNTYKNLQKSWQLQNTSYYKKVVVIGCPYVLWNSPQLCSIPLKIRDTGIITIMEHSTASKRSLQLWSIPLPNQVMESWIILNRAKANQTKPSQDKAGKVKPRLIWTYPCFIGAIFPKISTAATSMHALQREWVWLHFSIIKGTLFVEQSTFLSVSCLLFLGQSWNFTCHTFLTVATYAATLVAIGG